MKILNILLLSCLSGCATTAQYNAKMDTWLNHDVQELVNSWGYPLNVLKAPNGNDVYAYSTLDQGHVAAYTTSDQFAYGNFTFGGQTVNWYCNTFFEVKDKKIVYYRWDGNNCK